MTVRSCCAPLTRSGRSASGCSIGGASPGTGGVIGYVLMLWYSCRNTKAGVTPPPPAPAPLPPPPARGCCSRRRVGLITEMVFERLERAKGGSSAAPTVLSLAVFCSARRAPPPPPAPPSAAPGSERSVSSCGCGGGAAGASGDVPDISSGIASHDTRMSLFLAAFFVWCSDMDALLGGAEGAPVSSSLARGAGPREGGTHVGSTPGSTIISSGSIGGSAGGSTSGSRGGFHDEDISGEELERRTGCRDLPCAGNDFSNLTMANG